MIEQLFDKPRIYRIHVPLPQNPLKILNSYVIRDGGENLIIDTGFYRTECRDALLAGLKELNLDIHDTSILVTHLHSDHVGLVPMLLEAGAGQVWMSEIDYNYMKGEAERDVWAETEKSFLKSGFPVETMLALRKTNQARAFAPPTLFPANLLRDGDTVHVGACELTCIHTPGHTPGQMCLYLKKEKILFSADHVLFDITPNITSWVGVEDSLGDYLKSLDKIVRFDVRMTFPGHRGEYGTLYDRVAALKAHHADRLKRILAILERKGRANAWEIASELKWSMRGLTWEEFPDNQKWFAVGETLSHIDYLFLRGQIRSIEEGGRIYLTKEGISPSM